ncbi:Uncharacterised protein [Serratia fonticola]|uniref:RNA ligase domain-containing protein n=1 Tax=Serratia fonticola TaxID=47917 RepID=A0A448SVK4_SERFO|nr:Uncharacterised protein [Serratia fonticola]
MGQADNAIRRKEMETHKYGRTYHYPFSPGTTSDDRINKHYWQDIRLIPSLIHTEKLDGENNCLNRYGVFARSHAAPTVSAWTRQIRQRWQLIKNDLGDIELFGENLYATHSIEYRGLQQDFYLFAVRCKDMWLSWQEVQFYAALFDFACVPEVVQDVPRQTEQEYRSAILEQVGAWGVLRRTMYIPACHVPWKGLSPAMRLNSRWLSFPITYLSTCVKTM